VCVECQARDESFADFYVVLVCEEKNLLGHLLLRGILRKTSVRGTDGGT
jgi:hypothetical protein